jgi:diguanylate cyclase (GGDEF)-like protein
LTGLLNRHALDQCLDHLVSGAKQQGTVLTVAMIDIDHFKQLNDRHGHQAGDEVLRWVSGWLLRGFRATDLVARYGGEEFVVAFPDHADNRILQRLETLQRGIAETPVRSRSAEEDIQVTVSVGVARMPGDADGVHEVLALADRRMYAAKRGGRNQVVVTGDGDSV